MAMEFLGQTEYATVSIKTGYYYMDSKGGEDLNIRWI